MINKKLFIVPFVLGTCSLVVGCNNDSVKVTAPDPLIANFEGETTAKKNVDYNCKITSTSKDRSFTKENLQVSVSNQVKETGWYYINNELTIKSNIVTGDIKISIVNLSQDDYKFEFKDGGTGAKANKLSFERYSQSLSKGIPFSGRIYSENDNYRAPDKIDVRTVKGKVIRDYSYNKDNGELTIPGEQISSDIIVTATAIAQHTLTFSKKAYLTPTSKTISSNDVVDYGTTSQLKITIDDAGETESSKRSLKYALSKLTFDNGYPRPNEDNLKYELEKNPTEGKTTEFQFYDITDPSKISPFSDYESTFTKDTTIAFGLDEGTKFGITTNIKEKLDDTCTALTKKYIYKGELGTTETTFDFDLKDSAIETDKLCFSDKDGSIEVYMDRFGTKTKIERIDPDTKGENYKISYSRKKEGHPTNTKCSLTILNAKLTGNLIVNFISSPLTNFNAKFYNSDGTSLIKEVTCDTNKTLQQVVYKNVIPTDIPAGYVFDKWVLNEYNGDEVKSNDSLFLKVTSLKGEHSYKATYALRTFENDTWDNLITNIENKNSTELLTYYGCQLLNEFVGKKRKILLNLDKEGNENLYEYEVRVIGVNHDLKKSDDKVSFTFEFTDVIKDSTFGFNTTWMLDNYLDKVCKSILDSFENVNKDKVQTVEKKTLTSETSLTTHNLKIFPLSLTEIGLDTSSRGEGKVYTYYENSLTSKVKNKDYWLRSTWYNPSQYWYDYDEDYYIDGSGSLNHCSNYDTHGVSPAFVI